MEHPRNRPQFLLRYSLQSLAVIVLVAVFIRVFLFSSYVMSGAAMLPSIVPGDFLLAIRVPLKQFQRGTVVALRCPQSRDKLCLKRIVGLPGDRIEFQGDVLVVNGQVARYLPSGPFQTEIVAGSSWAIWPLKSNTAQMGPLVIPPESYFVLNDKRVDLDDSRSWGPVGVRSIEARILGVWMSLDWYESDHERVRQWPRVRWARLFRPID